VLGFKTKKTRSDRGRGSGSTGKGKKAAAGLQASIKKPSDWIKVDPKQERGVSRLYQKKSKRAKSTKRPSTGPATQTENGQKFL